MSELIFKENIFYFLDEQKTTLLLDCNDFLSNKSRIPMHTMEEGVVTIPAFLLSLFEQHNTQFAAALPEADSIACFLADLLLTRQLITSAAPAKVLLIGCDNGIPAFHIASVVGKLNPASHLTILTNTIVNNGSNPALDALSLVATPPQFSLCVADYDATPLQEGYYDIVIWDSSSEIEKWEETQLEAERLLKDNGVFLVLNGNQTTLNPASKTPSAACAKDLCVETLFILQNKLSCGLSEEEIRRTISVLHIAITDAIKTYDIAWKLQLIHLKELLQNLLLQKGTEFESYYKEELLLALSDIIAIQAK